jgi:hypothetical protein
MTRRSSFNRPKMTSPLILNALSDISFHDQVAFFVSAFLCSISGSFLVYKLTTFY